METGLCVRTAQQKQGMRERATLKTGVDLFLGQAYAALYRWMKDNGYQVTGPARQVRLRYGEQMNPTQYVTEVQYPVVKQGSDEQK